MKKKYIRIICFQIFIFAGCLLPVLFWKAVSRLDPSVLLPAASSLSMLSKTVVDGEVLPNQGLIASTPATLPTYSSAAMSENLAIKLVTATATAVAITSVSIGTSTPTSTPAVIATIVNFSRIGGSAGFGGGGELADAVLNADIQTSGESSVGSSGGSSGGMEVSDMVCPK